MLFGTITVDEYGLYKGQRGRPYSLVRAGRIRPRICVCDS
jgi:hypothetical protein